MILRLFGTTLMAMLLAACASGEKRIDNAAIQLLDSPTLPPPSGADLSAPGRAYYLGPFDELSVEVFGVEELSREVRLDSEGVIDYPLIGEIRAAGLTRGQLADLIETRLRGRFVRDPQVAVNVAEAVNRNITLDGEVTSPGLYPVTGGMTLMRAVALAGGLTEDADKDDVIVFRTVNGQRVAGLYNLGGIRIGNYADPDVYANDIVIVGDTPQRRFFETLVSLAPLLTTPLIVLTRR